MKNLTIAVLAAVSLLSFAGCKKKGGGSDAQAKMTEFKDQMCKCTDKPCADKVMEAMTKWGSEMAKEGKESAKPAEGVSEELSKCMQKAMASATPPPPAAPPADPAAAAPPAGDKPADPAAPAAPPAGDKPAAGSN